MDHVSRVTDWGGFAFWLFIAACVLAGTWEKVRKNAEKQETLRRIYEKTGTFDDAKLQELLNTPTASDRSMPGEIYRGLRIAGTIVMCIGAGFALAFLAMGQTDVISQKASIMGMSLLGGVVAMVGIGLFFSSRFAEPPPGRGDGSAR